MVEYYFIDLAAILCLMVSFWGLGDKAWWAFPLNVVGSILMIIFGVLSGSMWIYLGNIVFMILGLRGWWNWSREKKEPVKTIDNMCDRPNCPHC